MRRITAGSSSVAIRTIRPPHFGHASTSVSKARRMSSAQLRYRGRIGVRRPPVDVGTSPVGAGSLDGVAKAASPSRATSACRHGAFGASTLQEQVGARTRHQGHETLERLRRREHEMRRAVGPRALQRDGHPPVDQPLQAMLPEGRATEIAAEFGEPAPIPSRYVHGGVKVEAVDVRVQRYVSLHPWGTGVGADPQRASSSAAAERRAAEHGGARQTSKRLRLLSQRIDIAVGPGAHYDPESRDPSSYARDDAPHVVVSRCRDGMEAQRAVGLRDKDAVEHERVEVHVEIGCTPSACLRGLPTSVQCPSPASASATSRPRAQCAAESGLGRTSSAVIVVSWATRRTGRRAWGSRIASRIVIVLGARAAGRP